MTGDSEDLKTEAFQVFFFGGKPGKHRGGQSVASSVTGAWVSASGARGRPALRRARSSPGLQCYSLASLAAGRVACQ